MKLCYLKGMIGLFICICILPLSGRAQMVDKRLQVDTLSIMERLSIHTNTVDWTLLMPNIGVEFDIRNTNWNRWAVGLNVRGNWQTSHTFTPGIVYNLSGVHAYFRNYWRPRQIGDDGISRHTSFIDKVFSCRRTRVKHPGIVFYRGLYASYNKFSIKLIGDGYQGSAITAGFTYGIVKPLYVFKNGNSLDLDLGVSAGLAYAKYDRYRHDRESDCYPVTKQTGWGLVKHPVLSDLRVGFVYRLGKYPSTGKYRWRYDCDAEYHAMVEHIRDSLDRARINQQTLDSLVADVRKDFWHEYDSIMAVKKVETDSLNRVKAAEAAEAARLKQAEKERERQAKIAAKAEAKAAKAAAKDAAGHEASQPSDSITAPVPSPASSEEQQPSGEASPAPSEEQQPSDEESPAPSEEQQPSGEESPASSEEQQPSDEESPASSEEQQPSGEESPAPSEEQQPSDEASPAPSEEQQPSDEESPASSEEQQPSDGESPASSEEQQPSSEESPASSEEQQPSDGESPAPSEEQQPSGEESPASSEEQQPSDEESTAEESPATGQESQGKEAENE